AASSPHNQTGPSAPARHRDSPVRHRMARMHLGRPAIGAGTDLACVVDGPSGASSHAGPSPGHGHAGRAATTVREQKGDDIHDGKQAMTKPYGDEAPMRRVAPLLIVLLAALAAILT